MAKKPASNSKKTQTGGKPSALIDTRVIYCGDNLEQLKKLPDGCVDLIYIDPPFNSNRNYEVFWGETREKRAFEDRHASTAAYIDYMRPRCVELSRVLQKTGSFYYPCDWYPPPRAGGARHTRGPARVRFFAVAQKPRDLLLPLRQAREPLRQGDARPDS